jgi:hypothetical protein
MVALFYDSKKTADVYCFRGGKDCHVVGIKPIIVSL